MAEAQRHPRVTAIVLNWCGETETEACIRSLRASDYPELDLLLVDNASPDGSGDRLHRAFAEIGYLQTGRNLGYTGGNNRGIEFAIRRGCDYVLVINPDTVVEPSAVARLVQAAEANRGVGAVAPKILYHQSPDRIWFGGGDVSRIRAAARHRREGELDMRRGDEPIEDVSFLTGCCLLIPVPVLNRVGGFAEDFFMYVEDVEFALRLTGAGYRLLYNPGARVLHRTRSIRSAPAPYQIRFRDRNRRRLVRRRYSRTDRARFALFFYPTRLARMVQYLASGDRARAAAILRGMLDP